MTVHTTVVYGNVSIGIYSHITTHSPPGAAYAQVGASPISNGDICALQQSGACFYEALIKSHRSYHIYVMAIS